MRALQADIRTVGELREALEDCDAEIPIQWYVVDPDDKEPYEVGRATVSGSLRTAAIQVGQ